MIDYDEWASKFVGKCWHKFEWSDTDCYDVYYTCTKCGIEQVGNANFHPTIDDHDYMELVRYARNHEKWEDFIEFLLHEYWRKSSIEMIIHLLFSRELGTKAIYEFFSKEVEK
jgi:hypothetical protein